MLDYDLAELYETETKRLKEAVRRNIDRFPPDFMFEISKEEFDQIEANLTITDEKDLRTQNASSNKRGGIRYMPFAFTEQGVAMLASVLNSQKAIQVNISIVRAFVFIRQYALTHSELTEKLNQLENKFTLQFKDVYEALDYLFDNDKQLKEQNQRRKIGYK